MNIQGIRIKKQECKIFGLALSWILYAVGMAWLGFKRNWTGELLWVFLLPSVRWVSFQHFTSISRFLGYGPIADMLPISVSKTSVAVVTFYRFFSCPFCPIVLQRLEALQKQMGFTLEEIDITRNPQILMSKGIRSV